MLIIDKNTFLARIMITSTREEINQSFWSFLNHYKRLFSWQPYGILSSAYAIFYPLGIIGLFGNNAAGKSVFIYLDFDVTFS